MGVGWQIDMLRNPKDRKYANYDEVSKEIIAHEKYDSGMPIRILGCEAGIGGEDSPAQKLADALKKNGGDNPVYGAKEPVYATDPKIYKKQFNWGKFKGK